MEFVQLNGRVPEDLRDQFDAAIPNGTKKQHVMAAMTRLWVSLPQDVRRQLIDAESEGQPIQDAWLEAVRKIAQDEFRRLSGKGRKKKKAR